MKGACGGPGCGCRRLGRAGPGRRRAGGRAAGRAAGLGRTLPGLRLGRAAGPPRKASPSSVFLPGRKHLVCSPPTETCRPASASELACRTECPPAPGRCRRARRPRGPACRRVLRGRTARTTWGPSHCLSLSPVRGRSRCRRVAGIVTNAAVITHGAAAKPGRGGGL